MHSEKMSITSNTVPEDDSANDNIKLSDESVSKSNSKRNSIHADSTNDNSSANWYAYSLEVLITIVEKKLNNILAFQ